MKKLIFTFIALFIFSGIIPYAIADSLEGTYSVTGQNPGSQKTSYTGTLTIKKLGETYQVDWKIGNQLFGGAGIYYPDKKLFTVGYADLKQGWFGIVNYDVVGNELKGKWTVYKKGNLGTENLKKIK